MACGCLRQPSHTMTRSLLEASVASHVPASPAADRSHSAENYGESASLLTVPLTSSPAECSLAGDPDRHLSALPHLSRWSKSPLKRAFDLVCVVAMLPLLIPVFLLAALAVRLTSTGPVLFLQQRTGRNGHPFTIYKFRTMPVPDKSRRPSITTRANQRFTPVGPFLRRWKIDELPQLLNVLKGDMSLVGPRPKLPWLHSGTLLCRPGLTGRATVVFAREEAILSTVPVQDVENFYNQFVRPLKQMLDEEYTAQATFLSDLNLIVRSVVRRWDEKTAREALDASIDAALEKAIPDLRTGNSETSAPNRKPVKQALEPRAAPAAGRVSTANDYAPV